MERIPDEMITALLQPKYVVWFKEGLFIEGIDHKPHMRQKGDIIIPEQHHNNIDPRLFERAWIRDRIRRLVYLRYIHGEYPICYEETFSGDMISISTGSILALHDSMGALAVDRVIQSICKEIIVGNDNGVINHIIQKYTPEALEVLSNAVEKWKTDSYVLHRKLLDVVHDLRSMAEFKRQVMLDHKLLRSCWNF